MFVDEYGLRFIVEASIRDYGFRHLDKGYTKQIVLDTIEYQAFCDKILDHDIVGSGNLRITVKLGGKDLALSTIREVGNMGRFETFCKATDFLISAAAPKDRYILNNSSKENALRFVLYCIELYVSLNKSIYGRPLKSS